MRCVAVDWSGKAARAAEFIWIAEVRDGTLSFLENGRDRAGAIQWLVARATEDPRLVAGLDFAFSFPAWYCAQRGWRSGPEVWAALDDDEVARLLDEPPPFWGRTRRRGPEPALRVTEAGVGARSVFQIGGAGAVGTGSIRGMGHLLTLADAGFAVWPFHGSGPPVALEIYPRLMYPRPVIKSRWRARHELLLDCFAEQPSELLERAAGSEDAFDAAVSALVMARYADALATLAIDPELALEGRVWAPRPGEP